MQPARRGDRGTETRPSFKFAPTTELEASLQEQRLAIVYLHDTDVHIGEFQPCPLRYRCSWVQGDSDRSHSCRRAPRPDLLSLSVTRHWHWLDCHNPLSPGRAQLEPEQPSVAPTRQPSESELESRSLTPVPAVQEVAQQRHKLTSGKLSQPGQPRVL